jgi:glycerol kinase
LQAVAVLESIVFLLQENLEEFAHLSSPLESLRASGGLTVYDGLCQRLADISGLPLYRPRVFEATARGTAFLLAGCPATWPEPELGIWFKPHANPELRARYGRWKLAMQQAIVAGI